MYRVISDVIEIEGTDLSKCDLSGVKLVGDLRNIILPNDRELFQKIYQKSLSGVMLPENDYSEYNFNGVILVKCRFTKNTKLPNKYDLFQNVSSKSCFGVKFPVIDFGKYDMRNVSIACSIIPDGSKIPNDKYFFKVLDGGLYNVTMPAHDLSEYIFDNVNINGAKFHKLTILPKREDFFQIIENKDISYCTLPEGDYSKYDFTNISADYTDFGEYSVLPKRYMLFKDMSLCFYAELPYGLIDNLYLYAGWKNVLEFLGRRSLDYYQKVFVQ